MLFLLSFFYTEHLHKETELEIWLCVSMEQKQNTEKSLKCIYSIKNEQNDEKSIRNGIFWEKLTETTDYKFD